MGGRLEDLVDRLVVGTLFGREVGQPVKGHIQKS